MGVLRTLGRYEVLKHLASGGMAQVLLARAKGIENFERYVVIKQIHVERANDENVVEMFLDEARLAATLHHANIVQVHDIGQEQGEYFFAMEYVHGEDLRGLLTKLSSKRQVMPLDHIVTIALASAAALHHAHEQRGADRRPLGIVHRDVSPANILVGYDGNVKVVDFGIAKAVQRSVETHSGTLKGKISYMSPEQCMGQSVDRRSDVFSLGIVLFELVTVRRLFKAPSDFLTMGAIVAGNVPRPSAYRNDLPVELERIIMKALATQPQDRYQSADEMRQALDRFASSAALRTSTTALGDYMIEQFGKRPEPWLVDETAEIAVADVDFDGSQPGAAEANVDGALPPPVAGSPLARAAKLVKHRIRPATPTAGWDADDEKPTTASGTPMAWAPGSVPVAPANRKGGALAALLLVGGFAAAGAIVWAKWPEDAPPPAAASAPVPAPAPIPVAVPAPAPAVAPAPAPARVPVAVPAPAPAPVAAQDPAPAPAPPPPAPRSKKPLRPANIARSRPANPTPPAPESPAKEPPQAADASYDPNSLFIKKKP